MTLFVIRLFFIILCSLIGYQFGLGFSALTKNACLWGAALGIVASLVIVALELSMRRASVRGLSVAVFGLIFGLIIAKLLSWSLISLIPMQKEIASSVQIFLMVIFGYLGMVVSLQRRDEFNLVIPYVRLTRQDLKEEIFLLDTSVIIDGRIADLGKTRFIEGRFLVPRFVLKELQRIADSSDPVRRSRGRLGLEVLHKLRKSQFTDVKIHEGDFPEDLEVDAKLVKLAKTLDAKILTTDFNLNRIAELQGVKALNINELANSLKPVILPGEMMEIKLLKVGKEYNQAVAYLEDGTMVVVEEAKRLIGKTVRIVVTSVLQTQTGRMIFAKLQSSSWR